MNKFIHITCLSLIGAFLIIGCGEDKDNTPTGKSVEDPLALDVQYVIFGRSKVPAKNKGLVQEEDFYTVSDLKLNELVHSEFSRTDEMGQPILKRDEDGNVLEPHEAELQTRSADETVDNQHVLLVDLRGLHASSDIEKIEATVGQVYEMETQNQRSEALEQLHAEYGNDTIRYNGGKLNLIGDEVYRFRATDGSFISFGILSFPVRKRTDLEKAHLATQLALDEALIEEAQAQEAKFTAEQQLNEALANSKAHAKALEEAQEKVKKAKENHGKLQSNIEDLTAKIQELQNSITAAKTEEAKAKTAKEAADKALKAKKEAAEQATTKEKTASDELSKAKAASEASPDDEALKTALTEAETAAQTAETSSKNAADDVKAAQKSADEAQTTWVNANTKVEELEKMLSELQKELSNLKKTLSVNEQEIADTLSRLQVLNQKTPEVAQRVEQAQKAYDEKVQALEAQSQKITQLKEAARNAHEAYQKELESSKEMLEAADPRSGQVEQPMDRTEETDNGSSDTSEDIEIQQLDKQ